MVLHVRDIAAADTEAQSADVREVLGQLDVVEGRTILEVWNKIDLLPEDEREAVVTRSQRSANAVAVSAVSGEGIDDLLTRLSRLVDDEVALIAQLKPEDGEAVAWLYRHGRVVARREDPEGVVHLSLRLNHDALGRFERLYPRTRLRRAAE